MQTTEHLHALKIPFKIPLTPDLHIDRFVYAYFVTGHKVALIDSGVAGSERIIFQYLQALGYNEQQLSLLMLTHCHPDHMGAAKTIQSKTGCRVAAHAAERAWIEDPRKQLAARPVPGFETLISGPVVVDQDLVDGDTLELETHLSCQVIHTPGHSSGSVAFWFDREKTLVSGDALPLPGDIPIYDDIEACRRSIQKLQALPAPEVLLSSWEAPIMGAESISSRLDAALAYLDRIHALVRECHTSEPDLMALCQKVVAKLKLPSFAANPLVAQSFASSLKKTMK